MDRMPVAVPVGGKAIFVVMLDAAPVLMRSSANFGVVSGLE